VSEPRFFCADLAPGLVQLDQDQAKHALHSLRLRPGESVTLFDGCGRVAHGVLEDEPPAGRPKHRPTTATVRIERVLAVPAPSRTLTLMTAACKGDRLDWLVEKCTELDVTRIILTEFERSVVRPGKRRVVKLRRRAVEACKQCRRVWLPKIESGVPLAWALGRVEHAALLVAHPDREAPLIGHWLHSHAASNADLAVVVGPAGGISDSELEMVASADAEPVRVADNILRVETAAVSIAANWAAHALPAEHHPTIA